MKLEKIHPYLILKISMNEASVKLMKFDITALESFIPKSYIKHPFESGNSSAGRAQPCQG